MLTKINFTILIDSAILMNPKTWEASGHLASFYDPKIDCKNCKTRFRADDFISNISNGEVNGDALTYEEMEKYMLLGAFQLYLDFVNLFLKILQIFGKKNSNKK